MRLKKAYRKEVISMERLRMYKVGIGYRMIFIHGGKRYRKPGYAVLAKDYMRSVSINKKLLEDMTKALRRSNYAVQKIYPKRFQRVKNPIARQKLVDKFYFGIQEKFWEKYGQYIHLLYLDPYPPNTYHWDDEEGEEPTAEWFNLEDVKSKKELEYRWNFIREWKTYLQTYRKLMWGEGTGRREQNIKTYYYMRHRGKELKAKGRKRKEIYKILSKEVTAILRYCPGVAYQENGKIDAEYQTIQNASQFWHIVGDKRYDSKEYKKFRVTHEEDGKKKSVTLKTWYNKVRRKSR